jgi:hypothetical protein
MTTYARGLAAARAAGLLVCWKDGRHLVAGSEASQSRVLP